MRNVDFWVGLILTGAGGYALFEASGFDAASRVFPMAVASLLLVLGFMLFLNCIIRGTGRPLPLREIGLVLLCVVLVGGWALLLKARLGFALSTFLLQLGLAWLAGERQPLRLVAFAALITVVTYLIFVVVLDVRLPRSILSFIAPGL
ncbi:hypothetical protein ATN84_23345 [Paramesorhizobium deserti]|uniref:DUF1468 domain-containing protein n=2 Tax=Paramesorhizobium deserti TaxID=1494590 RepID=A0A135HY64_9HYPH|nr:hypothetical protein ATN84_23345 [Paramesorhizobium deserti]